MASFEEVINEYNGVEVTPMEAYADIFHFGEGYLETSDYTENEFKSNPIAVSITTDAEGNQHRKHHIMYEDTFKEQLEELQKADFAILGGLTYFGGRNTIAHANKMHAMVFDVDGLTGGNLRNFLWVTSRRLSFLYPNYVALSGHGVHLYYIFEEPISLYPNTKIQLKEFKYAATEKIWQRCLQDDGIQYQGINQGFRIFGGKTKEGCDCPYVRVYRMNSHPYRLEDMLTIDGFPEEKLVDQEKIYKESKYTIEEAKKKFPEWYERVVLNKQPPNTWTVKRDLYDWWLRTMQKSASMGHRYFCVMALAIYAAKCGISEEELRKDAFALLPKLNDLKDEDGNTQPFTKQDIESALECYDPKYCTFPRSDISQLTDILILPNKRNGRPQDLHLKLARQTLATVNEYHGTSLQGRKSSRRKVLEWQIRNPKGNKAQCARETGLSKPTVLKWWSDDLTTKNKKG